MRTTLKFQRKLYSLGILRNLVKLWNERPKFSKAQLLRCLERAAEKYEHTPKIHKKPRFRETLEESRRCQNTRPNFEKNSVPAEYRKIAEISRSHAKNLKMLRSRETPEVSLECRTVRPKLKKYSAPSKLRQNPWVARTHAQEFVKTLLPQNIAKLAKNPRQTPITKKKKVLHERNLERIAEMPERTAKIKIKASLLLSIRKYARVPEHTPNIKYLLYFCGVTEKSLEHQKARSKFKNSSASAEYYKNRWAVRMHAQI